MNINAFLCYKPMYLYKYFQKYIFEEINNIYEYVFVRINI